MIMDTHVYVLPHPHPLGIGHLGLRLRRIRFTEVNIWEDAEAAAAVRAVANGNETVPTVHVAGRWLVNPSASLVSKLAKGRE